VLEGADRAAQFLADVVPREWREDFTVRLVTINGLPGVVVHGPDGAVQTATFEIERDVIQALYVVRNPEKLRHLAAALRRGNGR
jgi:RNA polymerase sigma-70 factor (ECF subfamily)